MNKDINIKLLDGVDSFTSDTPNNKKIKIFKLPSIGSSSIIKLQQFIYKFN